MCHLYTPHFHGETAAFRFLEEAARELGADEDEATFKAKLAVVGRQKVGAEPSDDPSSTTQRKRAK